MCPRPWPAAPRPRPALVTCGAPPPSLQARQAFIFPLSQGPGLLVSRLPGQLGAAPRLVGPMEVREAPVLTPPADPLGAYLNSHI